MEELFNVHIDGEYMSLERGSFYNIIMFILGTIALVFNILEIIINISNKLYKQSLHNCIRLYSNIGATVLAIRNMFLSCLNLCFLKIDWFYKSEDVCLGRSIIDVVIVSLFQSAFFFQIIIFGISIVYPIFFMRKIDNNSMKIYFGIGILIISITSGCMMLVGRIHLPNYLGFCVIYNNWTPTFQGFHCFLTLLVGIASVVIYFRTGYHIKHMSSEEKFKENICSFMCWLMLFFIVFGILPNILLVVAFFMDFDCNFKNICLDTFYLTICVSIILPFPFALWKNKLIRRHFFELPFVPRSLSKISATKTSVFTS